MTPNLYNNVVVTPSVPPQNNGTKAMHATPPVAPADIIKQNVANRHAHHALVQRASGFKVRGGSKSKRSKRSKSKRASSKRYKRGGAPTPTPSSTPKPSVVPVPQFPGQHNVSASANSVSINNGLMKASQLAVYDDPNGPVSSTKLQ